MSQLKPRQLDIMQGLAKMLGEKGPVKITTSLLAAECEITEAAIYRHFPSKKKIYSGLVDFCEQNLFELIANINASDEESLVKTKKILKNKNNFRLGDKVTITDTLGSTKDSTVTEVISDYSFSIKGQGIIVAAKYTVQRKILRGKVKTSLTDYSYIDNYFSNFCKTKN